MFGSSFGIRATPKTATKPRRVVCQFRHGNRNRDWDSMDYYSEYILFKSKYSNIPITLQDVKEAYECCSGIVNDNLKCSCYQQFGVDCKMAEKYFKKMQRMEDTYYKPNNFQAKEEKKKEKSYFKDWFNFGKEKDQ